MMRRLPRRSAPVLRGVVALVVAWLMAAPAPRQPGRSTAELTVPGTSGSGLALRARVRVPAPPGQGGGGIAGDCAPQSFQYCSLDFEGQNQPVCVQAGFAEMEIAAVEFMLPADDFPLVVRASDMVFAQNHFNQTTTQWTWFVWDGPPTDNELVFSVSSDGINLPHITLPAQGSNGVNVRVEVDPGDPEQIQINNVNRASSVTIGYRIDQHNNQSGTGCNFGDIPANQNAFPTTDTTGSCGAGEPGFLQQNWLFAINCGPNACQLLGPCPAGWSRFSQLCNGGGGGLIPDCRPSGDWTMRLTYEPLGCSPGACCLPSGNCALMSGLDCLKADGDFQGSNTVCEGLECPEATGACCLIETDQCFSALTIAQCDAQGGFWVGPQTTCGPTACDAEGACCFTDGSCVNLSGVFCATFGGDFQGFGSDCGAPDFDCNPLGACCFPDGTCGDALSPDDCAAAAGAYQGNDSLCSSVMCPQPLGACCASTGACGELIEATCNQIPGAVWAGPQTTCADANGNGMPDACEAPCPGDTNGDGAVDVEDLVEVITTWGQSGGGGDVDDDGDVDVEDLVLVITSWGEC